MVMNNPQGGGGFLLTVVFHSLSSSVSYSHRLGYVLVPPSVMKQCDCIPESATTEASAFPSPAPEDVLALLSAQGKRRIAVHTPEHAPVAVRVANVIPAPFGGPDSMFDDLSTQQRAECANRTKLPMVTAPPSLLKGNIARNGVETALEELDYPRLVAARIADKLSVPPVTMEEVTVVRWSSMGEENVRYNFHPKSTLEKGDASCWISANGTAMNGISNEFLEYQLARDGSPRRIQYVGMRCPMPPAGPLAVKQFHLEWDDDDDDDDDDGSKCSPTFTMLQLAPSTSVMQWFMLTEPPLEASVVRLRCTKNFQGHDVPYANSIGFWEIAFR